MCIRDRRGRQPTAPTTPMDSGRPQLRRAAAQLARRRAPGKNTQRHAPRHPEHPNGDGRADTPDRPTAEARPP
eukprot:4539375-Prorocentrum_lima.AAC.1